MRVKILLGLLCLWTPQGQALDMKSVARWGGGGAVLVGGMAALYMQSRMHKLALRRKELLLLQEQVRERSIHERWAVLNALLAVEKNYTVAEHYRRLAFVGMGLGGLALGGSFFMEGEGPPPEPIVIKEANEAGELAIKARLLDFGTTRPGGNALQRRYLPADSGMDGVLGFSSSLPRPVEDKTIGQAAGMLSDVLRDSAHSAQYVDELYRTLMVPVSVPGDGSCGIHTCAFWEEWRKVEGRVLGRMPVAFAAKSAAVDKKRRLLMDEVSAHVKEELKGKDSITPTELLNGDYPWIKAVLLSYMGDFSGVPNVKPRIEASLKYYDALFAKEGSDEWLDVPLLQFVAKQMKCPVLVWSWSGRDRSFSISHKINFESWDGDLLSICHGYNSGGHWEPLVFRPEVFAFLSKQRESAHEKNT